MASSSSIFSPRRLAELRLSDVEETAFLFSYFDDDDDDDDDDGKNTFSKLHLKLFFGGDVFCGVCDVSSAVLRSAAEEFDVSTEEMRKLTLEALRISDNSQFLYDWRRDEQKGTLVWRRDSEGFGLSQQIGSAFLNHLPKSDAASSTNAAFSFASGAIDEADDRINSLKAEAARFEADRRRAVDRYEKVVAEAKKKEDEMLGKMVLLLNEKKAEIRRLKRKMETTSRTRVKEDQEEEEEENEDHERKRGMEQMKNGNKAIAGITDTQIYEQDTDVDSDASDGDHAPDEETIPAKKMRVGATSAPVSSASASSSASVSKLGLGVLNSEAIKSKSFVHNFLRDSSDEEL